nr:SMC-Scp complex subunit ScpB [Clostridia bacterium]
MKNSEKLTNIIESILFVSGTQVAISDIVGKIDATEKEINEAVKILKERYSGDSGIQLLQFNKKLQFSSNPAYSDDVSAVLNPIKEKELSKSMLEVAAIIAYKQPVTRIDLEEIRGNSEYAVQKLLELGVIEPVGRKDAVGRPVMFGTTDKFLKRFQISSLDELPDYEELLNRIKLIHGEDEGDNYLYQKDVYTEEVAATDSVSEQGEDTAVPQNAGAEKSEDFEIPDLSEEEIPDFLQGEKVDKI